MVNNVHMYWQYIGIYIKRLLSSDASVNMTISAAYVTPDHYLNMCLFIVYSILYSNKYPWNSHHNNLHATKSIYECLQVVDHLCSILMCLTKHDYIIRLIKYYIVCIFTSFPLSTSELPLCRRMFCIGRMQSYYISRYQKSTAHRSHIWKRVYRAYLHQLIQSVDP